MRALTAFLLLAACACWAAPKADDSASLTGVWKCVLKSAERPGAEGILDLKQNGEEVTGVGSNAGGSAPLKGTVKDGKFKLKIETGQTNWDIEGTLDGDKITATWAIPAAGRNGTLEGVRKKD